MRYVAIALGLIVFTVCIALGQTPRPELVGHWQGIAKTPVGTLEYHLRINKIGGEKVADTLQVVPSRVYTGEEPFEGTLDDNTLRFTTATTKRAATLTIEGDVMKGEGRGATDYKIENVRKLK